MSEPDADVNDARHPYADVAAAYHRMADTLSTMADQLAGHGDVTGDLHELIETTAALDRRMLDAHPA
jgi:hypothetical protein